MGAENRLAEAIVLVSLRNPQLKPKALQAVGSREDFANAQKNLRENRIEAAFTYATRN